MKKPTILRITLVLFLLLQTVVSNSQTFKTFSLRKQIDLRGKMIVAGNNILGKDNLPCNNDKLANEDISMKYIDIDGDGSTFSSSSADLMVPKQADGTPTTCYRVAYAALYWGAMLQSGSRTAINKVKLKLPGTTSYSDIDGQIVYDAVNSPIVPDQNKPYACYADVTSILQKASTLQGTYTVANVTSSEGLNGSTGLSAGWTLFVVYEDPKLNMKSFNIFDGFGHIYTGHAEVIPVTGFKTPAKGPIDIQFAYAALDGDKPQSATKLEFESHQVVTPLRPANEFFSSTIENTNGVSTPRNPSGTNTLGYDTGVLEVKGANPEYIDHDVSNTSFTLQVAPGQADPIFAFFTAYAVDVYSPDILLTKIVEDAAGNNVGGQNVSLGQNLFYEISYQSVGSDNVTNFTITDVLPKNVIFNGAADVDLANSGGATIKSYDPDTRTIIFDVPRTSVEVGDGLYTIRLHVQVVGDCNALTDLCSNEIKNQAFGRYQGVINPVIVDEGSFSSISACDFGAATPTNFLTGLNCTYTKQYILCANSVLMSAPDGYDSYSWSTSPTGSPVIGTNQTYTATSTGTYYVTSTTNSTCKSISETVTVVPYGNNITNPVIPYAQAPYAGEVVKCESNGKLLPNLFICGANATRKIKTGITDATSIIWEKLDEASCAPAVLNCANESETCKWTPVGTGPDYDANTAGQFRLTINYSGGCFSQFYFNVYQNPLNPRVTSKDITCKTLGEITVHDVPLSGYEFSLDGDGNGVYQSSNVFPNAAFPVVTAGYHNVYIRQVGIVNPCIFSVLNVYIQERIFDVTTTLTQPTCKITKGSIRLQANNVLPQYYYSITQGTSTTQVGPLQTNDYTFPNLNPGDYLVKVWTDDGCEYSNTETITGPSGFTADAQLTTPLTCSNGRITITTTGGKGPFTYYINGTFQRSNLVTVSNPLPTGGVYNIIVEDANNCRTSTSITVAATPAPVYTVKKTDEKCYGDKNGTITFEVTNANGYTLSYSIDNGVNYYPTNTFSNLAPDTYKTRVKYTLGSAICYGPVQDIVIDGSAVPLSAAGGVSELSGCGPTGEEDKGKVRITNPQGGTLPYTYSFDGGVTYDTVNEAYVAPGTYTLYVKDGNGCIFPITGIVLDPKPTDPTIELSPIVYNCDGTGTRTATITATGNNSYTYTYLLDGKVNTNVPSNVFVNIPTGQHTISVAYTLVSVPTYSNLLIENFGKNTFAYTSTKSPDGPSPGINPAFCWERQLEATKCNVDRELRNGEYTVTSTLRNNFYSGWNNPVDHTTGSSTGRYLAVDAGTAIPNNAVLYRKTIKDIIPGQPIQVRFFATNLLKVGNNQPDASLTVELQNASGRPLSSQSTGGIPKTNGWVEINRTINPGNNTTLDFVLRLEVAQENGIDFAVDDIAVYQLPKSCITTQDFSFVVDSNKSFTGRVEDILNVTCKDKANGSFNIIAENFNTTTGFQYSINGGVKWETSMTSPVLISGLAANTYDVRIRYNSTSTNCSTTVSVPISEPAAFVVTAQATAATCTTGSTITVSSVGGTAPYSYTLTDKNNPANVLTFTSTGPTSGILNDVAEGTYIVSGIDANLCTDDNDTEIILVNPTGPTAEIVQNTGLCFDSGASITVNVSGGLAPYSYQVSFNSGNLSGLTSFNGSSFTYPVTATGTYDFIIYDKNNCKSTVASQTINPKITASAAILSGLSCAVAPASPNATIEVEIFDGTGPYTYTVTNKGTGQVLVSNGSTAGPKFTYSAGAAAIYVFAIKDSNGCVFTLEKEVLAKVEPTATFKVENVNCYNAANGYIDITAGNGIAPFTYQFNGTGAFTPTTHYGPLAGSVAGTDYSFIVKDATQCTKTYTFKVFQPADIVAEAKITIPYTCTSNAATITATVLSGGNTGGFTYDLKNITVSTTAIVGTNNTGVFGGLTVPGTYTVTITDSKNCSKIVDAGTIVVPNPPKGMTLTPGAVTCPSNATSVTITDVVNEAGNLVPTAGLEYRIKSPTPPGTTTYQSGNVFSGLAAGVTYTFEVRDANKCVYEKSIEINALSAITVTGKSSNNISCSNSTDGSAIFTVTGMGNGVAYSYTVTPAGPSGTGTSPNAGTSFDITVPNLGAGTHTIVVTNTATTCSDSEPVTINAPTAVLKFEPFVLTHVTCDDKGTATINVSGGWGTYEYTVTPTNPVGAAITQTTNLFSNLNAGDYSVLVKDLNGCEITSTFTINPQVNPVAAIDAATDLCAGGAGATITVTPNMQTNYMYSINNGTFKNNGTFTGLIPGEYTVTVKDISTGCSINLDKQIVAVPVVVSDHKIIKKLDCSSSEDAVIEVTISDGYPDYRYRVSFNGAPFPTAYTAVGAGQTTFTYPAAASGSYVFEILDSNDCKTGFTENVAAKVTPDFTADVIHVKCFGALTGKITVTATPASGTYEYSKDGTAWQTSNEFLGLGAGSYTIYVRDTNTKCFVSKPIDVNGPTAVFEAFAEVTTELKCGTNSTSLAAIITVTATGGTPFTVGGPYRYTYNTGNPLTTVTLTASNTFTINAPGLVNITVTDANGCTVGSSATVAGLTPPSALTFSNPIITCDVTTGNLKVDVTGGKLPLKYEITSYIAAVPPTGALVATVNAYTHTFNGLVAGTYNFTITDDNGCTVKDSKTINDVVPIQVSDKIIKNVSCNGGTDGELEFTVSGNFNGTTGYTYTLVDGAGTTITGGVKAGEVITYSGLIAQTYTFTVTNDLTKCNATKVVTVSQPTAITALAATASKVYCDQVETSIKVTASGGTTPLQYAVVKTGVTPVAADYNTTGLFKKDTSVDGVAYDVYVKDKNGNCSQNIPLNVVKDLAPTIEDPAITCFKTGGTPITVTIVGQVFTTGSSTILYGIDGSYSTNPVKTISAPGDYVLSVKDANGCEAKKTLHVNDQLTLTVTPNKEITCTATLPATTDAKVTLSAGGGNSTYTYEYKKGLAGTYTDILPAGTNVFYTSDPGSYYFKVTSDGCEAESTIPFEVETPVKPVADAVATGTLCTTSTEGTIKISVTSGGTPPFYYTIDNWATENTTGYFTGLAGAVGTGLEYKYQVRDSKGCVSLEGTTAVVAPDPITFTIEKTDITCDNDPVGGTGSSLGSIEVKNVTGGTGQYTYHISNNFGYSASHTTTTREDHTFVIINFGIYEVEVRDANSCPVSKTQIIASPPEDLDINITTSSNCTDGGIAIVEGISSLGSGNYEFGIVEFNAPPYTNTWFAPDVVGGSIYTFKNLIPGVVYSFVVHDKSTNCYFVKTAGGPILPASLLEGPATPTNVTCNGANNGSVSFTVSKWLGSTTDVEYQIFREGDNLPIMATPISVPVDNTMGSFTRTYPATLPGTLAPGRYYIAYTEYENGVKGCQASSGTFEIKQSSSDLEVKASLVKNDNCNDLAGIIKAQASGGTGPYLYQRVIDNLPLGFGPEDIQPTDASFITPDHSTNIFYVNSGDYLIWVKDAYGCIQPTAVSVNVPLDPSPVIDLAIANKCAAEGAFEVVVSMPTTGMAPYYISVNNSNFKEVTTGFPYTIKGLSSGPVNVIVKDANDCTDTDNITITPTPTATALVSKVLDCSAPGNAVAGATITVTILKGTKPFTYQAYKDGTAVGTPVTLPVADNIFIYPVAAADYGTYKFAITDANSCPVESNEVVVDPIIPITVTPALTLPLCNGDSNGAIELPAKGGKGKYIYTLQRTLPLPVGSVISQSTPLFSLLSAGEYAYTITDELGCQLTGSVTLGEPTALAYDAPIIIPLSCSPTNTAQSATVTLVALAGSGTGPYKFSFNNSAFDFNPTYTVDEADAGKVIPYGIQDANGCEVFSSVTIAPLTPPKGFTLTPGLAITCSRATTTATISAVIGGAGPLSYQIISPSFVDNFNNPVFSGLSPDVEYVFQVTDANKCTFQKNLKIDNYINIDIVKQSTDGITCLNATDGKASFYVSGFGTNGGTYHYVLTPPAPAAPITVNGLSSSTINLTGLRVGSHSITVYDDETDCFKSITFDIAAPPAALVLATQVVTPLGCTTKGAVTITATGGWGDYTFTLTDPNGIVTSNNDGIFKNLSVVGSYDVTIKDANGCTVQVTDSFELIEAPKPTLTIATNSDYCYYNTDTTTLVITAASTSTFPVTFEYSIDNGETWHTSNTFDKLTPKTYLVKVRDNYGCESGATTTEIKPQLLASVENKKDIFCTGTNVNGTIRVSALGGYPDYSYTVTYNGVTSAKIPFGAGFSFIDHTVPAANPGSYVFTVYDSRDCSYAIPAIVMNAPSPVVFTAVGTSAYCAPSQGNVSNGSILFTLTSTADPKYVYSIQRTLPTPGPLLTQETPLFTGLTAGTYTVNVTSGRNCGAPTTVTINDPSLVVATATAGAFTCASPANTLNATVVTVTGAGGAGSGALGDYTYSADGTNWKTTNTFNVIDNGSPQTLTYYVRDANRCIDSDQITVAPFPTLKKPTLTRITQIACNNTGEVINVQINGGSIPYNFDYQVSVDGGAFGLPTIPVTGNTFTYIAPLAGHIYHLKINDLNTGCFIISDAYIVPVFNTAKVVASASEMVSCFGNSDGKITISITDYKGPYDYEVLNANVPVPGASGSGNSATANPFTIPFGLPYGSAYTVRIIQTAYPNCTIVSDNVNITQPAVIDLIDFDVTVINQNCKNAGAVITVDPATIKGGSGGFTFAFVPAGVTPLPGDYKSDLSKTIVTTQIAPAFEAWDVYVKDKNDCPAYVTVNVSLDPMPAITNVTVASQCYSTAGYRIDVAATGLGLQYSLDGVQFQDDSFFTVFAPGDYTVTVRDKNKCEVKATTPVKVLKPLTLRAEVTTTPTCTTGNGEITLYAEGGSATTPPSYVYTIDNWNSMSLSPVFGGLAPGTYTFKVRDNGTSPTCEKELSVQIEIPTLVTGITTTPTPVSCHGGSNGSIKVTLTDQNNNPVYLYSIISGPVTRPNQESSVFNNLPYGLYTVMVTSGKGCSNTATVTVSEPAAIVVNEPAYTQFGCTTGTNTKNAATITVNAGSVTGGSGKYILYQFLKDGVEVQKGTSNTYTVTDLSGGDYVVNVFDDKNCQGSSVPVRINPFVSLDKINFAVVTPITCDNTEILQVSVDVTGTLFGQLEYTLSGTDGTVYPEQKNYTGLFIGLGNGNYLATVTNPVTGCSIKDIHYVFNANTFVLNATPTTAEICYGTADGSVRLTLVDNQLVPVDDAGIFDYTITDAAGNVVRSGTSTSTSVDITGLRAGIYSATAKLVNTPFCSVGTNFQIVQPSTELVVEAIGTPITCVSGNNDGVITVSALGGWLGAYEYKVDGPISFGYSDQAVYQNLTAGLYTITVKDSKGCTDVTTVNLVNPAPITVVAVPNVTMLSCNGDKTATITVNPPTGGQGSNYTYTLNYVTATGTTSSGPFLSPVFTGLGAGTYTVTVKDGFSCEATSVDIVISEPLEIIAKLEVASSQTCLTQASLTLSATGGTGTYTYSADANFATVLGSLTSATPVTFSVPVGTYRYFVKDSNGCVSVVSNDREILPIAPLSITLLNENPYINCTGDNSGAISATAQGGLGNYVYTLLDSSNAILQGPQDNGDFKGLVQGTYTVHVDSGDCKTDKVVVIKEAPVSLTAPFIPTNITCFGANNGKIVINASGGTGLISYAISPDLDQFSTVNVFDNLAVGVYQVIVQDELGCYVKIDFEIIEPKPITASEVPNSMIPEICKDDKNGAFSIEIKGGTEPYSVSLDNENGPFTQGAVGQTIFDFTNLSGGTHTVYIIDAANCEQQFVEDMPLAVTLNPTNEVTYDCVNNTAANMVTVDAGYEGDAADIDYRLDGGQPQMNNIFTNLAPGDHTITVTHTNGCNADTTFKILQVDKLDITVIEEPGVWNTLIASAVGGGGDYMYSIDGGSFSPENKFIIYKTGTYTITVMDKNGCTDSQEYYIEYVDVCLDNYFTPAGSTNTAWGPGCTNIYTNLIFSIFDRYGREIAKYRYGQKWDGRYNGEELPSGDYWYVLKLNDEKDAREFVGHFTLYR